MSERVDRVRCDLMKVTPSICPQRATLLTSSYQETEGLPMVVRRALGLQRILSKMDIFIEEEQLVVGNQASSPRAAPIFPEYSYEWVIAELDAFAKRPGDVFTISEQAKDELRKLQSYWRGRTHQDEVTRNLSEVDVLAVKQGVIHRGGISMSGDGHIIPNHDAVLAKGYGGILTETKEHLANLDRTKPEECRKIPFYRASVISLEAAIHFGQRFATLAEEQAATVADPHRRQELEQVAAVCRRVPEHAPQTFHEALQTVYLTHLIMMIESNGHSFSFGRFDQYMSAFYKNDRQNGTLTRDQARELLALFFIKLNSLNKVRPWDHTPFGVGYPLYSNLMVGGMKADGSDGTNELTYLCMEAIDQVRLPEPNFSVRFWEHSPPALLTKAAALIREGFGMPSLFADETVIASLYALGIPIEVARDYASMGCVEVAIPGQWGHRATGMTYINMAKILELLLHNGRDPDSGIRLIGATSTDDEQDCTFASYEELWETWQLFLKFYTDLAVQSDNICDISLTEHDKDPFASSLIDDCLIRGKTLKEGGARYDFVSQSTVGTTVVGDSLAVIKRLVFDEKKVSFTDFMAALRANWQGEQAEQIHRFVQACPRFGNDDDFVDAIVAQVYQSYLQLLPHYHTDRYGKGPFGCGYTMSTSNISSNVPYGLDVGATPDGRKAREPLNEGGSPCRSADKLGPTAVLQSMSKLPNKKMAGGQLLNQKFSPSLLRGETNLEKFVSYLKAFRQLECFHIQFNIVDAATLRAAQQKPDEHRDLMVRVAGYCALFTSLMPEVQEDIIQRTEQNF